MSDAESVDRVENANHVENSHTVNSAEHVGMVASLEGLELHTPIPNRTRLLVIGLIFLGMVIVVCALLLSLFAILDKRHSDRSLAELNGRFNAQTEDDRDRLNCVRRFQDEVDAASTDSTINIGDIVVILSTIPNTNPDRINLINTKVAALKASNEAAEKAVADKAAYNRAGNPLPCPLS